MKLTMMGSGYVGLVTGACFADMGSDVICVDSDAAKVDMLRQGKIPIYEPGLEELVRRNFQEGRLQFTTDAGPAIAEADVVFICVGTPQRGDGKADLAQFFQVVETIGRNLKKFTVIVHKSTVPVGTTERVTRFLKEITKVEFEVVSNPEFLKEGAAIKDFQNPDRIVIGVDGERARDIMKKLYSPHARVNRPILFVKPAAAELIKYAANAMLASRISFMNSIASLCERMGADIKDIAMGLGLDTRIGPRFLQASPGYGGSCFPKDVRALVDMMESLQLNAGLFRAIDQVNELHKKSHLSRLLRFFPSVAGLQVAVWGLSFKPRTDDIRESPSLTLIEQLIEGGAKVMAYDPEAIANTRKVFPQIGYAANPYDAVHGAHAVMVMTEWDVFRNLDFARVKSLLREPVIIDCRNIYDLEEMRQMGFKIVGVGRA